MAGDRTRFNGDDQNVDDTIFTYGRSLGLEMDRVGVEELVTIYEIRRNVISNNRSTPIIKRFH